MAIGVALLVTGCGREEKEDLKAELAVLTKDVRPSVEPLPEVKPYAPTPYTAEGFADPFSPLRLQLGAAPAGGFVPDPNRPREPLEAFALEELKIVGTIVKQNQRYAIINAHGKLHQVRKGNYIGTSFGLISEITATEIRIKEIVQDQAGDWTERLSVMPLGELSDPQRVVTERPDQVVPILFGTNRKKSGSNHPDEYFLDTETNSKAEARTILGRVMIRVPEKHEAGALEQPGWIRVIIERIQPKLLLHAAGIRPFKAEDPNEHFTFASPIEELTPNDFQGDLRTRVRESRDKAAFVFVHGYANTFRFAAYRTAQLSFDLKREGYEVIPILFSWPSGSRVTKYPDAKDRVRSAGARLATFLSQVSRAAGSGSVHIIAHSMGADVLATALAQLGEQNLVVVTKGGRKLRKFNQIVLAAPDIRRNDFADVIAPAILTKHRVTNYASSNDAALQLSRKYQTEPRIGDTNIEPLDVAGVETIDATTVNSEPLGHAFFAESPRMIRDLRRLLKDGERPGPRGLTEVKRATWTYWRFP